MDADPTLQLESDRLALRESTAEDVDLIHRLFASNPEFLSLRADIASSEDGYDRESVRNYCDLATLDPERHLLVAVDKESKEAVGIVDFVDESPADGLPWIGLVLIDGAQQRRGFGAEAVGAVAAHLESAGYGSLRVAVLRRNEPGLGFARSIGFVAYDTIAAPISQHTQRVVLMEMALPAA
jgi:RimJ/RimL family protein N-acetyltransferase